MATPTPKSWYVSGEAAAAAFDREHPATPTPGPWDVYESGGQDAYDVTAGEYRDQTIASGIYGDANARLIAAAPELLAALRTLLSVSNDHPDDETCECPECESARPARALLARIENGG